MTLPSASQPSPAGLDPVDTTRVAPVTVSSPLTPLTIEKRRSSLLSLLLGLALAVAVGGVAFAAGRLTAPATTAATGGRGGNGFGGGNGFAPGASGAPGGAAFAGGPGGATAIALQGTIDAITPTSITLRLASGATVEIPIDSSTTYHGQTAAASTDVRSGQQVRVEVNGFVGFGGGRGGQGGGGQGGGQGGANASAPPAVGAPGSAPAASPGASAATGGSGTGQGGRPAVGPARDITIVTP